MEQVHEGALQNGSGKPTRDDQLQVHNMTKTSLTPQVTLPDRPNSSDNSLVTQLYLVKNGLSTLLCRLSLVYSGGSAATTVMGSLPRKRQGALIGSATPQQTMTWLQANRFAAYLHTFASFSGADLMRLSRDDLIQICGLADGIRLFNSLHPRANVTHQNIWDQSQRKLLFALSVHAIASEQAVRSKWKYSRVTVSCRRPLCIVVYCLYPAILL
ncbi:hypothetical protein J6590_027217 [Homalodisca vitripennis]|nr:hypothetical protein J6590_027217 [Homalodisca vitripennis]